MKKTTYNRKSVIIPPPEQQNLNPRGEDISIIPTLVLFAACFTIIGMLLGISLWR